jgi:diguanylate cyclase (GGDEF)-like protein/putative nucleotidyltransferase with HDIG domain
VPTHSQPTPGPEHSALAELRGLLHVARAMRSGAGLEPLLEAIARVIGESLGYGAVVVNLYRRAFDDYQVAVMHGGQEARDFLLGTTSEWAHWEHLLDPRFERHGAYLIPHGAIEWPASGPWWVPDLPAADGPDAWHAEDALLVPLRGSDGALLGILSIDEPLSGRRPGDHQLEVLGAVAAHAAVAIEHAQGAEESLRHRTAVEHLLRVSSQLSTRSGAQEMFDAVCVAISDALGFERVMLFLPESPGGELVPIATCGWPREALDALPSATLEELAPLLHPAHQREGCILLAQDDALALVPPALHDVYASATNGRGPLAWSSHWLLVPLHDRDGDVIGAIWVDDPSDHLLPTTERLQALRAFANQASAAVQSARQLEHLRHLADHDPLTGLRNRREFEPRVLDRLQGAGGVALLVCDLDNFKRVNDSLGHEAGDEVLRRFSDVLRRSTRGTDVPTRLGGEEFAVLLPGTGRDEALAVAERLRLAVRAEFEGFAAPVSVSVGVAASSPELTTAADLTRAANRALYAAKRLGRDRVVPYHAETLSLLDDLRDAGGASDEQLAAAMLLAETLDLRDLGTSRHSQTVGRLCELIAHELGWTAVRVERLRAAGVLHDIGKLGISDKILHKPGKLDDDEWEEIRRHPEIGARILEHAHLKDIAAWVLRHHERVDGRGYPDGLAADEIPVEARVLAVADAYEAMTADRPYRAGLPRSAAEAELREGSGTQFDPDVVAALLRALHRPDAGTGEIALATV